MNLVDDAILLAKKIGVTVLIYLVPVTIVVGGLLLTEHFLRSSSPSDPSPTATSK